MKVMFQQRCEFRNIKRKSSSTFFCPILCALSMACRSFIGFQSCSTNMTVSAPVKLRPSPPETDQIVVPCLKIESYQKVLTNRS